MSDNIPRMHPSLAKGLEQASRRFFSRNTNSAPNKNQFHTHSILVNEVYSGQVGVLANALMDDGYKYAAETSSDVPSKHLPSLLAHLEAVTNKVVSLGAGETGNTLYRSKDASYYLLLTTKRKVFQARLWANSLKALNSAASSCPTIFGVQDNSGLIELDWYQLSGDDRLSSTSFYLAREEIKLVLPGLYPDIDIAKLFQRFADAEEPVLILRGPPGVGKTSFVRYYLRECITDSDHATKAGYVKDPVTAASGRLWSSMSSNSLDVVIFDDLDNQLQPRDQASDPAFMNNLLSYTDGIFTKPAKVLITTNLRIDSIDSALVRPGRCFDIIELHPLSYAQAQDAWVESLELPVESFLTAFPREREIAQAELVSASTQTRSSTIGRDYMRSGPKTFSLEDRLHELGIQPSSSRNSFLATR